MPATFNIFSEEDWKAVQAHCLYALHQKILAESPEYILNVNPQEYIAYLYSEFCIEPLVLDFEGVSGTPLEKDLPAECFLQQEFAVEPGEVYRKPVIRYHLPFAGDPQLLKCRPSQYIMDSCEVFVEDGCVCFDVVDFFGDPARVKQRGEAILGLIRAQYASLQQELDGHYRTLHIMVDKEFYDRRNALQKQHEFIAALGIPIKRATNVPTTFSIPVARKKIVLQRPTRHTTSLDPTVNDDIYASILQVIQHTGQVFERLPSTYAGKDEETLRDHLILQLEPHFEMASATGETFNKEGKTDILIRYEKKNVFAAECKWWHGRAKHAEAIDQLLSYLTWRDSKTAIVYFVSGKQIVAPLKAIEDNTRLHPCFVAAHVKKEESWFVYDFHLPGDPDRLVKLNILCFHLPATGTSPIL